LWNYRHVKLLDRFSVLLAQASGSCNRLSTARFPIEASKVFMAFEYHKQFTDWLKSVRSG
jgi:hypothetical protein